MEQSPNLQPSNSEPPQPQSTLSSQSSSRTLILVLVIAVALAFAAIGFFYWRSRSQVASNPSSTPTPASSQPTEIPPAEPEVYQGTFPCADCPGIQTQLTINPPTQPGQTTGTYQMTQTYLERSVEPIRTSGNWEAKSTSDFPQSTISPPEPVIVLDPGSNQQIFLVGFNSLTQLDANANQIEAGPGINFTLTLEGASATGTPVYNLEVTPPPEILGSTPPTTSSTPNEPQQ